MVLRQKLGGDSIFRCVHNMLFLCAEIPKEKGNNIMKIIINKL